MRVLLLPLLALLAGCTSVSSTLVNRDDSDYLHGNSNGKPCCFTGQTKPLKGVPITLRLPTHLDIVIKENIFIRKGNEAPVRLHTPHRHLFLEKELVETEKVFTVDPKRPAAGTLKYNMTFGDKENEQYFKSIAFDIQDNTIKEVTNSLNTLLPLFKQMAKPAGADDTPTAASFDTETRTVAWKRFDLDAIDLEQQVYDFVSVHFECASGYVTTAKAEGSIPPNPALPRVP